MFRLIKPLEPSLNLIYVNGQWKNGRRSGYGRGRGRGSLLLNQNLNTVWDGAWSVITQWSMTNLLEVGLFGSSAFCSSIHSSSDLWQFQSSLLAKRSIMMSMMMMMMMSMRIFDNLSPPYWPRGAPWWWWWWWWWCWWWAAWWWSLTISVLPTGQEEQYDERRLSSRLRRPRHFHRPGEWLSTNILYLSPANHVFWGVKKGHTCFREPVKNYQR